MPRRMGSLVLCPADGGKSDPCNVGFAEEELRGQNGRFPIAPAPRHPTYRVRERIKDFAASSEGMEQELAGANDNGSAYCASSCN
jgi:hypothetical protein